VGCGLAAPSGDLCLGSSRYQRCATHRAPAGSGSGLGAPALNFLETAAIENVPKDTDPMTAELTAMGREHPSINAIRETHTDFATVYGLNVERVLRWAHRLVGPTTTLDADDIVQEVFITAHRLLPRFRGECQLSTWLYRLTENAVRHHRRREKRR